MNILFLSVYSIDTINDGYIYADLIKTFVEEGHNVYAVTLLKQGNIEKSNMIEDNGCHIIKVKTGAVQKVNRIKKVINLMLLENKTIAALKTFTDNVKFDLVVPMTSNLSLMRTITYIKKRDNAKVYCLLKDIFPQNAVDIQFMKNGGVLHKLYLKKEQRYYDMCNYIGCISPKNIDFLFQHNNLDNIIVEENPNSVYLTQNNEITEDEKMKVASKYEIDNDKTVFFYGGNLGKPQGIDFILEVINGFESKNNANLIIVGDGTESGRIAKFILDNQIKNTKLFKRIPQNEYDTLVSLINVGLVFLDKRFTIPNYPSRVLSYMEAKLPIIFATDEVCDAKDIAEANGYGFACISGDLETFFAHVDKIAGNNALIETMGQKGYEYLVNNYTTKNSYDIIMKHFLEGTTNV